MPPHHGEVCPDAFSLSNIPGHSGRYSITFTPKELHIYEFTLRADSSTAKSQVYVRSSSLMVNLRSKILGNFVDPAHGDALLCMPTSTVNSQITYIWSIYVATPYGLQKVSQDRLQTAGVVGYSHNHLQLRPHGFAYGQDFMIECQAIDSNGLEGTVAKNFTTRGRLPGFLEVLPTEGFAMDTIFLLRYVYQRDSLF